VRVPVVERLREDDAGSDLQGPVVDDDHPFWVDRLGQEPLPQLPGLLRPGRELFLRTVPAEPLPALGSG
jgi:hypothetical protein